MPTIIAPPENETDLRIHDGSVGGNHNSGDNHWGGGDSDRWGQSGPSDFGGSSHHSSRLAMWLCMASITMLFAGLSSAYVFRLGLSSNEPSLPIPRALIWNSLILLGSSFSLEVSRKRHRDARTEAFHCWLFLTAILGVAFVILQLRVWRQLSSQGVYLSSSPHASFFYLLTGTHAVHLFGGILALGYAFRRAGSHANTLDSGRTVLDVTAMYWHFMTGLWVYLFLLLFYWR